MKNLFVFSFVFFTFFLNVFSQKYEQSKIVVRFDNNFDYNSTTFDNIISNYKINRFLSNNIIQFLRNEIYSNRLYSKTQIKDYKLENIYVIEYTDKIDPLILSEKLKSLPHILYAEPVYVRNIYYTVPNDSLFSEQYYFGNCMILDALELLKDNKDSVVIGVVDTGVDYLHEDLTDVLAYNKGEMGLDEFGNDKRSNNIDDDNNGFIDDWRGWDFGSSDSLGFDNDPYPGGGHGTHVAGIIAAKTDDKVGVAGINPYAKVLAVKIGYDNPFIRSLIKSYEGLLYAALAGADIINCSWGGGGYSNAEQEIINQALEFGPTIVAAAGNDFANVAFYPAAYDGVISVASTNNKDTVSWFTNYHYTVDISAPGSKIMSTIPGNAYASWDGTSMASPIVSAIAGFVKLKYPELNYFQIGEYLKSSSDNIDNLNPFYLGLIGRGRVNAFNVLSKTNFYSLYLEDIEIKNKNNKNLFQSGDTVQISFKLFNVLEPLKNVVLSTESYAIPQEFFINDTILYGNFNSLEHKISEQKIEFIIPDYPVLDLNLSVFINIKSDDDFNLNNRVNILINPSFRTITNNKIAVTITSEGNIGYKDFPTNSQGIGLQWNNRDNLLFEGALMVAKDTLRISDMARYINSNKSHDFFIEQSINETFTAHNSTLKTFTKFRDEIDTITAGVQINNTVFQVNNPEFEDCIITIYDIKNIDTLKADSVFAGLYFDWDIGPSGSYNYSYWDYENRIGITYNHNDDSLEYVGVFVASEQKNNYFAIDNDGMTEENPGVYDAFTKNEKWRFMSSGIGRDTTGIKDVSCVIAAGPIQMDANDTARVIFGIVCGHNAQEIVDKVNKIRPKIEFLNINDNLKPSITQNIIKNIYPNPVRDNLDIEFENNVMNDFTIEIIDIFGNIYKNSLYIDNISSKISITTNELQAGTYFVRVKTKGMQDTKKFIKIK